MQRIADDDLLDYNQLQEEPDKSSGQYAKDKSSGQRKYPHQRPTVLHTHQNKPHLV